MKKNKVALLIFVGILLIVSLEIGMSYSLWTQSHTQETGNELLSGCFSTTLTENNNISLTNQYPISDATGLTGTPYTFTISNTCTIAANYQINLETLSTTTADSKFIKLSLDGATLSLLNSYTTVDTTITGALASYQLKTGYLSAGSSITYNLRLWVTESATTDDIANKIFDSKIVVNTSATHDSLEDTLINNAGGKTAIAAKTAPNFSKTEPLIASYNSEDNNAMNISKSDMDAQATYLTYGSSYTIDGATKTFTITNPQSCKFSECYSILSNMYINQSETSDISATSNDILLRIKNVVYDSNKNEYQMSFSHVDTAASSSVNNMYVLYGDSYTFDSATGNYSIVNGTIGKYTDVYNLLPNKYYLLGYSGMTTSNTSQYINRANSFNYDATNSLYVYEVSDSYSSKEIYDSTASGMYTALDDYGTSYYYRGDINNNNIIFGGFCWKAVRVNGNGTTRMIYNGSPENGACTATNSSTEIGESNFNNSYNDNAYVGYMYGTAGSSTYLATHANANSSTVKTTLDNWYSTNLSTYSAKISDTLYCNDRSIYSGTGIGNTATTYSAYNRLVTNHNPILTCTNKNDRFTTADTAIGNGNLTYPIGLISADELVMGGFVTNSNNKNTKSYLYNGNFSWTMTPSEGNYTNVFLDNDDYISSTGPTISSSVRPVINLKSGLIPTSGNGTSTNPYQIS